MSAKKVIPAPEKTEAVKAEVSEKKVESAKEASVVKEAAKVETAPVSEKKTAAPKKAVPKTSKTTKTGKTGKTGKTEKPAVSQNVYIQFAGKEILEKDIVDQVKQAWVANGHRAASIKSLDVYVKPEENMAYYVVNGKDTGSIEL